MTAAPFAVQVAGVMITLERNAHHATVELEDGGGRIAFSLNQARAIAAAIRGLADVTSGGQYLPPYSTTTPSGEADAAGQASVTSLNDEGSPSDAESSSPSRSSAPESGHERIHVEHPGHSPAEVAAAIHRRLNQIERRRP